MPGTPPWTAADVPDQTGRTVVVTGANSGIGLEAASVLAGRGARVVLACRDLGKARGALEAIRAEHRDARLELAKLDLASLASVREFAKAFADAHATLDVLLANAGVMAVPRRTTADGFELQLGTNHLGHFALTALLLPQLLAAPAARIVVVSSGAHRAGRIRFDDLQGARRYGRWTAYAQSKLANLLFAFELERRLRAAGARAIAVACHPGYAATNLQFAGPRMAGSRLAERWWALSNRLLAQDARMGALPLLYAATAPDVRGGEYFGPGGFAEQRGYPARARPSPRALDLATAARLWESSAALTGTDLTLDELPPREGPSP
jgi:NAD(P)-dependent dehydrogenase (short-subunit alcohol dehydrogenase family)